MVIPDPMNIRNRIEQYSEDRELQILFKAVYLLGAMPCEMLGDKYESDSRNHVYGPTGNDSWEKTETVQGTKINTVFFRIKTAKTRGREERTVLLPIDCEPWAKELFDYFKLKRFQESLSFQPNPDSPKSVQIKSSRRSREASRTQA